MRKGSCFERIMEGSLQREMGGKEGQDLTGLFGGFIEYVFQCRVFVGMTLELMKSYRGEEVGSRLDDPIIRIFADEAR